MLLFHEVMIATEICTIDMGKNSDAMRNLTNIVHVLAWGPPSDVCHWANEYPLNRLLYVFLLQTIFDLWEPTVVLGDVNKFLEFVKKTWPIQGISQNLHNVY
jgi:hypothetical protein